MLGFEVIGVIQHIVFWKFREGADPSEFLTKLAALEGVIPQIRSMSVSRSAVPGSAYDAALVSMFDTWEDVQTYRDDPRHRAVAALCKAIRTDRVSIDTAL